jgi:hypothetical protein
MKWAREWPSKIQIQKVVQRKLGQGDKNQIFTMGVFTSGM